MFPWSLFTNYFVVFAINWVLNDLGDPNPNKQQLHRAIQQKGKENQKKIKAGGGKKKGFVYVPFFWMRND